MARQIPTPENPMGFPPILENKNYSKELSILRTMAEHGGGKATVLDISTVLKTDTKSAWEEMIRMADKELLLRNEELLGGYEVFSITDEGLAKLEQKAKPTQEESDDTFKRTDQSSFRYELHKDKYGWVYTSITPNENGSTTQRELCDFDKIELWDTTIVSVLSRNRKEKLVYIHAMGKESVFNTSDFIGLKHALGTSRIHASTKITRIALDKFHEQLHRNILTKQIFLTECYGFYEGKHIDSRTHKLYTTIQQGIGDGNSQTWNMIEPTQGYKDFMLVTYNNDDISELIKTINEDLPRDGEKHSLKTIIAWCIGCIIKFELRKHGCNLFPILLVLGPPNTGKSTRLSLLISLMFKTPKLESEHLEGRRGARLGEINKDTFPLFFDEVDSFPKYVQVFKAGASTGVMRFPKGMRDGGVKEVNLYNGIAITSNDFTGNDEGMAQRQIILDYFPLLNKKCEEKTLIFLEENIHKLGKYIYDKLSDVPISELTEKIKKQYSNMKGRELDYKLFLGIPELILDTHGILTDTRIDVHSLLKTSASAHTGRADIIRDIIWSIITRFRHDVRIDSVTTSYTVASMIDEKEKVQNVVTVLDAGGLHMQENHTGLVIGKNILPQINEALTRRKLPIHIKNLSKLAELLGMEDKLKIEGGWMVISQSGNRTSRAGINFASRFEILGVKPADKQNKLEFEQ